MPAKSNMANTVPQDWSDAGATRTTIIGISGPSSSGKTTLARLLRVIFSPPHDDKGDIVTLWPAQPVRSFIIHEDDFYKPDDKYGMFVFLKEWLSSLIL
jgi:uridine kinase